MTPNFSSEREEARIKDFFKELKENNGPPESYTQKKHTPRGKREYERREPACPTSNTGDW